MEEKISTAISVDQAENAQSLISSLNTFKKICGNSKSDQDFENIQTLGKQVVNIGSFLLQLQEEFFKQGLLSQFYTLACSFHRQHKLNLATSLLEAAVELNNFNQKYQEKSDNLNADNVILMKVYFELACCWEEDSILDQCIADFNTSLHQAMQNNDVPFEKMILLRLCNVLMKKEYYEEAVFGYIRLLAIRYDIKETLDSDMIKFKAHWTIECECEIRYNLCIAYKCLHLYERSLKEAIQFKKLLQNLTGVHLSKPKLNKQIGVTHMMQINSVLGELYELLGNLPSSLQLYQQRLDEIKKLCKDDDVKALAFQSELVSAYESVGRIALKMEKYNKASNCFGMIVKLGQNQKTSSIEVKGLLLKGDVLLEQGHLDRARNTFEHALKIAQSSIDDEYETECRCMQKEAEVFANEHRYSHALYRCEQALSLSKKFDKHMIGLERQVAWYSQHSTSENELIAGLKFLFAEILNFENKLEYLRSEEASELLDDEKILHLDYKAIQVILYRLGEQKLSLAFGECLKRRVFIKTRNEVVTLPRIDRKEISVNLAFDHIRIVKADQILPCPSLDQTIVSYTMTDAGILAHVYNGFRNLIYSYLSADHVVHFHNVEAKVFELVTELAERSQANPTENLQILYNIENRCLPDSLGKKTFSIVCPKKKTRIGHEEGGDFSNSNLQSKETLTSQAHFEEGDTREMENKQNSSNPLKELHSLLVQPLCNALRDLPDHSRLQISVFGLLSRIPFDHLVNSVTNKALGETFNVIITPCLSSPSFSFAKNSNQKPSIRSLSHKSSRRKELLRSYVDESCLDVLEKAGMEKSLMGLVSSTASGSNIISSSRYTTPYLEVEFPDKAFVIGSPSMPNTVQYGEVLWKPPARLSAAQLECKKVAQYLDVYPVVGDAASKSEFLKQFRESTLIHVCTFGSSANGLLAFHPDKFPIEKDPVKMDRYIVSLKDLLDVPSHHVKLLVLSSAQNWHCSSSRDGTSQSKLNLANTFLAAGVQSVVYQLWSVPDVIAEAFYFHFYLSLQRGLDVSRALHRAKCETSKKHPNSNFWNAFVAAGNDVTISLSELRNSQIHRSVNKVEENKLDASLVVKSEHSKEYILQRVQDCVSSMLGHLDIARDDDIISFLLGLVEEATDRLSKDENTDRSVVVMPEQVLIIKGASALLELAGFDFQNVSISSLPDSTRKLFTDKNEGDVKMVVFPHWNQDELLLPIHQALSGILEITDQKCLQTLSLLFPLPENLLCKLVDFLALLYHSPHLHLHIIDHGTSALWNVRRVREFLRSIGVDNARSLIVFCNSLKNKSLLMGSLQLLLSVCCQRDRRVLDELHLETLGKESKQKEEKTKRLNSFKAVVMPRNEILVTSSWMASNKHVPESSERKLLATEISNVSQKYSRILQHAKWWHQDIRVPKQSGGVGEADGNNRPQTARKVKVLSGATPSCKRIPVDPKEESRPPSFHEILRRREEARNILQKRCADIKSRHLSALRSSYLPYCE